MKRRALSPRRKVYEYPYVYPDGTEAIWGHTERHRCYRCRRYQLLADPDPPDNAPAIVDARKLGMTRVIAAFWCVECDIVSICGAQGQRPMTAHYSMASQEPA